MPKDQGPETKSFVCLVKVAIVQLSTGIHPSKKWIQDNILELRIIVAMHCN